jgi:putative transposase
MTLIDELDNFINQTNDSRELKRALAVKMVLQRKPGSEIEDLLQVSPSFVRKWKNLVIFEGVESLKLQYQGRTSYLTAEEKEETINWLRQQDYCRLEDLQTHLEKEYGVIYQSTQSYYSLFNQAQISWKKTQKKNPLRNEKLVQEKKEEIKKKLETWQEEIETGKLAVFMIDECHLLWGDILGYVWGRTDIRVEIPIKNEKDRQTYYGALDYATKEFIIKGYPTANTENTIKFLKYLQQQRPGQKLAIFGDGATYHRSQAFQDYLDLINQGLSEEEWPINCTRFAPNAPDQNPVEDIWLQVKNFVRKFWHICKSFKVVKWLFELFADGQVFDFPKIFEYELSPQPT